MTGPDGDLWFTEVGAGKLGEINPTTHVITEYPLPNINERPTSIALGPDNNLWFADSLDGATTNMIGVISSTTHQVFEFPIATPGLVPTQITLGKDGNLWYSEAAAAGATLTKIGAINPTTHATTDYVANADSGVATGPDGNIWFTGLKAGTVGDIDLTTHAVSEFSGFDQPTSLVTGPDGNLWVNQYLSIAQATIIPANQAVIRSIVRTDPTGQGVAGPSSVPAPGQTVYLDLKNSGNDDPGDPTAVTDANGQYTFAGIAPGTYTVRLAPFPGDTVTSPAGGGQTITVAGGQLGTPATFLVLGGGSVLPLSPTPNPFGTNNPSVQVAEVTGLYETILGRAPDAPSLAYYVSFLQNGGPLQAISSGLLHSAEYDTLLITSYYRNYLDHAASVSEVNAWVPLIQGGLTVEQVAFDFLDSDVFAAIHPDTTSFITALYADILGVAASSSDLSAWQAVLSTGVTRSQAVLGFLDSPEAYSRSINGFYATFLARPADTPGLTFYTNFLKAGGSLLDVAASISSSAEFIARANTTVG